MTDHVILLHGVWMRGFTLFALRRRLEAAGFSTEPFEYASVVGGPEPAVARLTERARSAGSPRVHLVGHSLGGMIALQTVRRTDDFPPGHVVCLGSPLSGSAAARGVARLPGGQFLLGRSFDLLRDGLASWDGSRPAGVIAGSLPIGLGAAVAGLGLPNDGTVSVEETRLPGLADHRTVAATHTGLLFSEQVAVLTAAFLRNGKFD